jgi:hypothetical protein
MLPLWELDRKYAEKYNSDFTRSFDNIVDFVQLHYMTKRNDTLFWRTLPEMMTKTDFIKEHLEVFKKTLPNQSLFMAEYNMFQSPNWAQVMNGLELLDTKHISDKLIRVSGEEVLRESYGRYNQYLDEVQKGSYLEHKVLLDQNRIVVKLDR